ncbi:MAG: hypothetical protein LBG87_09330 [Spirochaetaceae bacterium]|nr:hypothetical protein [Spirochaetaceae bacterium]
MYKSSAICGKTPLKKTIVITITFAYMFIFGGCSSLHAYMYILAADYDGNAVLKKEEAVRFILEQTIEDAYQYTIKAYTRTAISYKVKKTKSTTHSFYVITREGETYKTLSYSATGKWATSAGAWALNTDTDISSYEDYLFGENKWKVEEIYTKKGINTLKTITNVTAKMDGDITYYYRAKVNKNDKIDNCNTALWETLTEN